MGRRLGLGAGLIFLLALWLAPSIVLRTWGPDFAAQRGWTAELEGVGPRFPWGASAARAKLVDRRGRALALDSLEVDLGLSRADFTATYEAGRLHGWSTYGGDGELFLASVPAEALPEGLLPLPLHGPVDGVIGLGDEGRTHIRIAPGGVKIFEHVLVEFHALELAAQRIERDWTVERFFLDGPLLALTASGTVSDRGDLDLRAEISRVREPVRTALAFIGLDGLADDMGVEIHGTTRRPQVRKFVLSR